jgi:hypothetical protein
MVFGNWLDLNASGTGHFPGSLLWAEPVPASNATYDHLAGKSATFLNKTNNGAFEGQKLTYVNANVPSTGPTVISVNPISRFEWAATAVHDGRCYGVLMIENPTNPAYGTNYYAKFPVGQLCEARVATAKTVKLRNTPT